MSQASALCIFTSLYQESVNYVIDSFHSLVQCEPLIDQCLAPDTSGDGTGCDNMTCIIICFKPRNTAELQPESGKRKLEGVLSTEEAEENGNSDNKKKAKRD